MKPTKTGIVLNQQQLTCLTNILNQQFTTSTTTADTATPTAATTLPGLNDDFPDFDDMFLLEHLIGEERREKLERRFVV